MDINSCQMFRGLKYGGCEAYEQCVGNWKLRTQCYTRSDGSGTISLLKHIEEQRDYIKAYSRICQVRKKNFGFQVQLFGNVVAILNIPWCYEVQKQLFSVIHIPQFQGAVDPFGLFLAPNARDFWLVVTDLVNTYAAEFYDLFASTTDVDLPKLPTCLSDLVKTYLVTPTLSLNY